MLEKLKVRKNGRTLDELLRELDEALNPGTAYLISYDVEDSEGSDDVYDKLKDKLEDLEAKPVLYSQWVLRSESTSSRLRDRLRRSLTAEEWGLVDLLIIPFVPRVSVTNSNEIRVLLRRL